MNSKILLIIFLSITSFFANAKSEVCVLNYLLEHHDYILESIPDSDEEKDYLVNIFSTPRDIFSCISQGAEEIVIIAHSSVGVLNKNIADLVFFTELSKEESDRIYHEEKQRLGDLLEEIGMYPPYHIDRKFGPRRPKYTKAVKLIREYKEVSKRIEQSEKAYSRNKLLPSFFKALFKKIGEHPGQLKRIRIASCNLDKVKNRYPYLLKIAEEYNVEIDTSFPVSKLGKLFFGRNVVSIKSLKNWIKK